MQKQKESRRTVSVTIPTEVHRKLVEEKKKTGKAIWFLIKEAVDKVFI
jgi:predicted DNA-binding protein